MSRLTRLRNNKNVKGIAIGVLLIILLFVVVKCNQSINNNPDTTTSESSTKVVETNPTTQQETVSTVLNNTLLQEFKNAVNGANKQTINGMNVYTKKLEDQGTIYTSTTSSNELLVIKISRYSSKNQLLSSRKFALPAELIKL
jgi:hypothetical protein